MYETKEMILDAVKRHHEYVEQQGFTVVMTCLIGSQNYNLNHDNSDIDTFSFIYPSFEDLASGKELYSHLFELDDGHCEVKDIRLAFKLLSKASPNSVEFFTTPYKIYNPIYAPILKEYIDNDKILWDMIHCNYTSMINAIAGMAMHHHVRKMPAGKQYSIILRLKSMLIRFLNDTETKDFLLFIDTSLRNEALKAKLNLGPSNDELYNSLALNVLTELQQFKSTFQVTEEQKEIEYRGLNLIEELNLKLFKKYIMETNINGN